MVFVTVAVMFTYFGKGLRLIAGQRVIATPACVLDVTDRGNHGARLMGSRS